MFGNEEKFVAAVKEGQRIYEERQAAQAKTATKQPALDSSSAGLIQRVEDKAGTHTGLTKEQEFSSSAHEKPAKEEKTSNAGVTRTCSVMSADLLLPPAKRSKIESSKS
jgi:hypothetical protein